MGLPIAFALTGGEVSDFKGYLPIMNADGPAPKVLLADKGYDADYIREDMERRGGTAMIPTKRNRKIQLPVDPAIYALRNMVERCFNKLKNARRLATRYDKTADSYLGFIHIASIRLWMREFVNRSYVKVSIRPLSICFTQSIIIGRSIFSYSLWYCLSTTQQSSLP